MIRLARHSLALAALALSVGSLSAQVAPPPTEPPVGPLLPPPPAPPPPAPAAAMVAPAPPAAPVYLATRDEALSIGRATTQQVYAGQVDALILTADPANGDAAALRARLATLLPQIAMQLGAERRMIREQVMKVGGRIEYWRTVEYENAPVPLIFRVAMGDRGKWRGFAAVPQEQGVGGEEVLP